MISRREVQRATGIQIEDGTQRRPFPLDRCVTAALNRVADVDDESGVLRVDLAEYLLVDARLRVAGTVAENGESETGRGRCPTAPSAGNHDADQKKSSYQRSRSHSCGDCRKQ